jgi:hypothetical protein
MGQFSRKGGYNCNLKKDRCARLAKEEFCGTGSRHRLGGSTFTVAQVITADQPDGFNSF